MSVLFDGKPVKVLFPKLCTDVEKYTIRETAGGIDILDGIAQVKKIQGDTVKSNNLFYTNQNSTDLYGVTITYDETKQEYTLNGTTISAGNVILSRITIPNLSADKYYTLARIKISGSHTMPAGTNMLWSLFNAANLNEYGASRLYENNGTVNTIKTAQSTKLPVCNEFIVYLQMLNGTIGTVFDNFKFKLQLVEGNYTSSTMPEYTPYFAGLKNACIDSIKSTGSNIFNLKVANIWKTYACEMESQSATEIVLVNTGSSAYQQVCFPIALQEVLIGKTIQFSGEWECSGGNNACISIGWLNHREDGSLLSLSPLWSMNYSNKTTSIQWYTINEVLPPPIDAYQSILCVSLYSNVNAVAVAGDKVVFRNVNVVMGNAHIPFEPYKESIYKLPVPVELPAYDSVLPPKGAVERKTGIVESTTGFTDEEIATYKNAIVSLDRKTLAYELETAEYIPLDGVPETYTAWNGGTETIEQGETDNSKFGAEVEVETDYVIGILEGDIN